MYLYASIVIQYFFRPQSSSARPPALNMGPAQATREAATASRVFSSHVPLTGPQSAYFTSRVGGIRHLAMPRGPPYFSNPRGMCILKSLSTLARNSGAASHRTFRSTATRLFVAGLVQRKAVPMSTNCVDSQSRDFQKHVTIRRCPIATLLAISLRLR